MKKGKRWVPKDEGVYWLVKLGADFPDVVSTQYLKGDMWDENNISEGNCFRTKREALAARKRVLKALKGE